MSLLTFPDITRVQAKILQEYSKMSAPNLWGKNYQYFKSEGYTYSMITKFLADMKALCQEEIEQNLASGDTERVNEVRTFRALFLADKRSHVQLNLDENGRLMAATVIKRLLFPQKPNLTQTAFGRQPECCGTCRDKSL